MDRITDLFIDIQDALQEIMFKMNDLEGEIQHYNEELRKELEDE